MDEPYETLQSIAFLVERRGSSANNEATAVEQRTAALLQLQRAVRTLVNHRSTLTGLLGAHVLNSEESVTAEKTGQARRKLHKVDPEQDFVQQYETVVRQFEDNWDQGTRLVTQPATHFRSWLEEIHAHHAETTVHEFVQLLLRDLYALGAGLATLEGSILSSLLPTALSDSNAPLQSLLRLFYSLKGPESVLQLVTGMFEIATREIVGRETSLSRTTSSEAGIGLGIGLSTGSQRDSQYSDGIGQAREKELETFMVGALDLVESLGFEAAAGGPASDVCVETGPTQLGRGVEDILVDLLHSIRSITRPRPQSPSMPSSNTPRSSPTISFNPTSWGSTVTSTFSQLSHLPLSGFAHVANGAAAAAGLNSPITPVHSPEVRAPPVPPKPISSPSSAFYDVPSSPSQLPALPKPLPSPVGHLLYQAAASLLDTLSFSRSSPSPAPLVEVLISRLIASSRSSGENSTSPIHQKLLLVTIVRWWAFSWLGRKLGRAAYGGALGASSVPVGVMLTSACDQETSSTWGAHLSPTAHALLDEIYVSGDETTSVLLELHRLVYAAIVSACGVRPGSDYIGDSQQEHRLQSAAESFVAAWSAGSPAPEQPKTSAQLVKAVDLSPDEFIALVDSCGPLVLRYPARGPLSGDTPRSSRGSYSSATSSPTTTFKRSTAFGSSSPSMMRSDSSTSPSEWREAKDATAPASLQDRLEVVLHQLTNSRHTDAHHAILYASHDADGKMRLASKPLSLSSSPSSAVEDATTAGSGTEWTSPPRSPRQDGLRRYLQLDNVAKTTSVDPFLAEEITGASATPAEIDLLRRGLSSLARAGYASGPPPASALLATEAILRTFDTAAARALSAGDFPSYVLFRQSVIVLQKHTSTPHDKAKLINQAVAPLRREHEAWQITSAVNRRRLENLELMRERLIDLARVERGVIDDLRLRAWYSSVRKCALARQLRVRLAEIQGSRTPEALSKAKKDVKTWRKELGVPGFLQIPGNSFDEALMLVETVVELSMQPAMLFSSKIWAREEAVVTSLIDSHTTQDARARPSLAEALLSSGSALLSAPLALAGLQSSEQGSAHVPTDVILSFGAATPNLLRPQEASVALAGALEEFLLRIQLKLTAYLWSDLSTSAISNCDSNGVLIGCDSWFEALGSPLSPLVRNTTAEVMRGARAGPKAYQPSSQSPPPKYILDTIKRFIQHPSPSAKLHAALQLELVLSAQMEGPPLHETSTSDRATAAPPPPSPPPRLLHQRSRGQLGPITNLMHDRPKQTTLSPAIKLFDTANFALDWLPAGEKTGQSSRGRSRSRRQSNSSSVDLLTTRAAMLDLSSSSVPNSPTSEGFPTQKTEAETSPATTEDLVHELESILLHAQPATSGLFQTLQIIASLTPTSILDRNVLGKAFWDMAGAALSIKRDIVEGEHGVVERGIAALSDGTEEGRELACRLIKIAASEESSTAIEMLSSMGLEADADTTS